MWAITLIIYTCVSIYCHGYEQTETEKYVQETVHQAVARLPSELKSNCLLAVTESIISLKTSQYNYCNCWHDVVILAYYKVEYKRNTTVPADFPVKQKVYLADKILKDIIFLMAGVQKITLLRIRVDHNYFDNQTRQNYANFLGYHDGNIYQGYEITEDAKIGNFFVGLPMIVEPPHNNELLPPTIINYLLNCYVFLIDNTRELDDKINCQLSINEYQFQVIGHSKETCHEVLDSDYSIYVMRWFG